MKIREPIAGQPLAAVENTADAISRGRWSPTGIALVSLAFLVIYIGLEWLSFMHEHRGLPVTPWNPGLGVAFALIVWGGWPYGALLFAGVILAEWLVLQTALDWVAVTGIGAIYSAVYSTVALIARQRFRFDTGVGHLSDIGVLLVGAAGGAVCVAVLLNLFLGIYADFRWADFGVATLPLLIGDLIGIAVLTPLVLRLLYFGGRLPLVHSAVLRAELALYGALVLVTMWLIGDAPGETGFDFFYLLFVPVVMAGVRYGLDGACIGLAFTQFCLVGVLQIYGTDAQVFTQFQTLMFVLTGTGLIVGVVVSERQEADRRRRAAEDRILAMQAEAAQEARFHLVSGMASALAHEINQPLTAARALVRSAEQLIGRPEPDLPRARNNLGTVLAQIDHAGNVLRRIRSFLSRKEQSFSTLDLAQTLEEGLVLIRAEAAARQVRLDLDVPADLPQIVGDRVQLQQVLLNLVRNSIEAIAGADQTDGVVAIKAAVAEAPSMIEVAVSDNGPGLPAETAAQVFAPLNTSKSEGLGLGLPICASIIENHGGRVWIAKSEPGNTQFRFSLPIARREA